MKSLFYVLIAVLVLFAGCDIKTKKKPEHSAIGEIGEVIIFSDETTLGLNDGLIDSVWGKRIPSMNYERTFKVRKSVIKDFNGYTRKNYNLFILVHKGNWPKMKPKMSAKVIKAVEDAFNNGNKNFRMKNVFVKPQMVYFILADNVENLANEIRAKSKVLLEEARYQERNTTIASLVRTKLKYDSFYHKLMDKENFAFRQPQLYNKTVENENFYGFSRYMGENHLGVYSYSEPYNDVKQFDTGYILHLRDSMLQLFIKGPIRKDNVDTYMKTYYNQLRPIEVRHIDLNGHYVIEVRGWWEMMNNTMGGPFVSYTIHSEILNRVITLEANVFAPGRSKRRLIRELELIMSTFTDDK